MLGFVKLNFHVKNTSVQVQLLLQNDLLNIYEDVLNNKAILIFLSVHGDIMAYWDPLPSYFEIKL